MLSQMLNATLRILFFRAGPQDFPYAPRLASSVALLCGLANVIVFSAIAPVPLALIAVSAMLGALALVTQSVLRARQMQNRFQQTFNSLVVTTTVLNLLLLPALLQVSPLLKLLAQQPEMLDHPESLNIAPGAALVINVVNIWNFAVTAHIFRHAVDTRLSLGVLMALIAAFVVLFMVAFSGALVGAVLGVDG
jgi:hypothetical protein